MFLPAYELCQYEIAQTENNIFMNTVIKPFGMSEDEMHATEKVNGPWKKSIRKVYLEMYRLQKPDEADIAVLEAEFGKLPLEYRDFLRNFNGGVPVPNVVATKDNERVINFFFPIKYPKNYPGGFYACAEDYAMRIPDGMLPIASSGGGDLILIQSGEENHGKVYYWDHELESESDASNYYDNVELLAASFNELLNKFYDDE